MVLAPSTGRVTAFDATTGDEAWHVDVPSTTEVATHHQQDAWGTPGSDAPGSPVAVVYDQVDDLVRAHDPATGALRWEHETDLDLHWAVAGADEVLLHSQTSMVVLDAHTGHERLRIEAPFETGLVHLDPTMLVHPPSGHVVRVDAVGTEE